MRNWQWTDLARLEGIVSKTRVAAHTGDTEIWDYKGTKANTKYIGDYVRQLLTYAALYKEGSGELPRRCVLFFVNETTEEDRLLSVEVNDEIVSTALFRVRIAQSENHSTTMPTDRDSGTIRGTWGPTWRPSRIHPWRRPSERPI